MHQTFYVEVDEEISSVIDRLNKSMSIDNYFVVPKRALFLQSIVNLKIFKREAEKSGKRVVIVTQEEMVEAMAKRSGIETCETLDGLNAYPDAFIESDDEEFEIEEQDEADGEVSYVLDKQDRLRNLGSNDYYQGENFGVKRNLRIGSHKLPASKLKIDAKKTRPQKIVLEKALRTKMPKSLNNKINQKYQQPAKVNTVTTKENYKNKLDPHKEQTLEKLFSDHQADNHKQKQHSNNIKSGRVKKIFGIFVVMCVLVFLGVAGYLFAPSAKIVINSDVTKKNFDKQIKVAGNENGENAIPLKVIEREHQITLPYELEGQGEVIGKKARGKVVIYNEYSSESQTLISTTRLEAEGGKIFRIVKNVVIPGASNVGGQLKPGAIEAEIIADQAGGEYNIEATRFSIPGFKGGPKFEKFYATSDLPTTGGSGDGQIGERKILQKDLDDAKLKAEKMFKEKAEEMINENISDGEIALPQAQKIEIIKSSSSAKLGNLTESFDWIVIGTVKAFVFEKDEVTKIVLDSVKSEQGQFKNEISKIDYGSTEPDFDALNMNLKVYAEIISVPVINSEKIKQELLGKSDNQIAEILRKYPSIKNADVEFSPSFITRIPQYSSRVSVEVLNEAK